MPVLHKRQNKLTKKEQSLARLENFRKEVSTDAHTIPLEELCQRLNTDLDTGLSPKEANNTLIRTGPNCLTPAKRRSECLIYLQKLFHGFSILLWIGSALCYLSLMIEYLSSRTYDKNNLVLANILIAVIIVTESFTYYQEYKSRKVMDSFANMVPSKAVVIRGGYTLIINSKEVVTGDLVELKFGDRVPADIRLIRCESMKVDNSPITGESDAQPRSSTSSDENYLESKNVVFFSTNILEGTGKGIVIACGDQTVMGRIAGLTARLKANKTPLAKELERFMRIISIWACFLGVFLAIVSLSLGYSLVQTLLFAIGLIVANVPEGLTATVILCLTLTAQKMLSKNCLIKKLESVETLGSTSVICSDKTGTLTQNRMTVCHVWCNGRIIPIKLNNLDELKGNDAAFRDLVRCASLCNRAMFVADDGDKPILARQVSGDASESAIFKFIEILNLLGPNFRIRNPKLIEQPFSSSTKYQISVHALETGRTLVVVKGAPEVILERCSTILYESETKPMDAQFLNICEEACRSFAEMGERVLGFCDLELDETFSHNYAFSLEPANFPLRGLRFLGLIAMIDPPRPQVPDAINKCRYAGIKVAMVTGDHPVTAKAIAVKVGILTGAKIDEFTGFLKDFEPSEAASAVISGAALRSLQQEQFDLFLEHYHEIVFARTSPQQKLQIVEGYQRLGEIVAVTGDGVNDAPALKKADIGIAMGITGTEVSQQAADIILMDDNFASIILGIEEGRRIFDNLKKSITYTLSSNIPELMPFIAYYFLRVPLPLNVIAVICIDLLTDMMPAISLAYEKAESDIMLQPPRNPLRDRLVTRRLYFLAYGILGMFEALSVFFVYFLVMAEFGFNPDRLLGARSEWEGNNTMLDSYGKEWSKSQRMVIQDTCSTASMMAVVVSQWANLLACRTRRNSLIQQGMRNMVSNVSLVVETVFTLLLAYTPYMYIFSFYPLHWRWWLYAIPYAVSLLCFDELRKWHIRKYPKGWFQRETYY